MKRKKYFVLTAIAMFHLFCSCDNERDALLETETDFEENVLSFSTYDSFLDALSELSNLSETEQKEWIKSHFGIFYSLADLYNQALADADDLDESKESYTQFHEKYANFLFFPEYKEDYGFYLPVKNSISALLLNKKGEVKIGNMITNMKDISNYAHLQEIGIAMYDNELSKVTRSSNSFEDDFENEYDSGWFVYDNSKKIKLKCGRQIVTNIGPGPSGYVEYRLHFEISFRKKTWLGWTNYSSRVDIEGDYNVTESELGKTEISESKTADSSHDYYYGNFIIQYAYRPDIANPLGTGFVIFVTPVTVNLTIHYRGIPDEYMPGYHFVLPAFAYG